MLSKVLYGHRGANFDAVIQPLVRQALCTGSKKEGCDCYSCSLELSAHPDYMLYEQDKYAVEEIDALVSYAQSIPIISQNKVAVLKNLSGVTEVSQNKLLKELEDNKHFILIATDCSDDNKILPTIKSRTESVSVMISDTLKDFEEAFGPDAGMLYRMSRGNLGLARELKEQVVIFTQVKKAFDQKDRRLLFEALALVKNKDNNNYFTKYKQYVPVLFDFMADIAITYDLRTAASLLEKLNIEKSKCLCAWYNATSFFTSIVNIIEAL